MKLRFLSILLIVSLIFPLTSCIVTSRDTHVDIACDDFSESPSIVRNEFTIEVGDKVYVGLCSNPTTGFKWSYTMSGDPAVKEEDYDYQEPDSNLAGAPGKENWTFEGINKGTAEILMEYSQPWDGGTKREWTYRLTITVD